MNKQELMKNYTQEQLADKIIALEILLNDNKNTAEILKREHKNIISEKQSEIDCLKAELQRKENTINQIDDILEKLFGIRHDIAKPNEFEKILKEKIENGKTLEDFLPLEPIKVADVLINAKRLWGIFSSENGEEKVECKYHLYSFEKLRQIAQHLLIYCDANKEI